MRQATTDAAPGDFQEEAINWRGEEIQEDAGTSAAPQDAIVDPRVTTLLEEEAVIKQQLPAMAYNKSVFAEEDGVGSAPQIVQASEDDPRWRQS